MARDDIEIHGDRCNGRLIWQIAKEGRKRIEDMPTPRGDIELLGLNERMGRWLLIRTSCAYGLMDSASLRSGRAC